MERKLSKRSKLSKKLMPRFQNPFNKENKNKSSTRKKAISENDFLFKFVRHL